MTSRRTHLITRGLAGLAAMVAAVPLILSASPASADTQPPNAANPPTVSTDVLAAPQINGVVWTQIIVGNVVYVGGEFTSARPAGSAAGTNETPRQNFLAYDLTTGALLPFAPNFNAAVRTITSLGNTLYVGGSFTTVTVGATTTSRYRVAAFDLTSNTLKTSFTATANATVYGLAASAATSTVYIAGIFSSVNSTAKQDAAAVDATTGAVKTAFGVTRDGGRIKQVAVSPDGNTVVLGGSFTSLNGSSNPGYGLARVNATTGALLALPLNNVIRDAGDNSGIMSLTAAPDGFYGSGYVYGGTARNLEGSFKGNWDTGELIWMEDCHGDTYSTAVGGNVLYVAGHSHDCARIGGFPDTTNPVQYHHSLAFTTARTGTLARNQASGYANFQGQPAPTLLHWFPDWAVGSYTGQSQAVWSVAANADYVVYGGEFPRVDGKAQQGLARFAVSAKAPNKDAPQLGGADMGFTARTSFFSSTVTLSLPADYDRDNTRLTYTFYRDGVALGTQTVDSTFWNRPTVTLSDRSTTRGRSYSYYLTAADPFGNIKTSSTATVSR